jgi:hypothetical protein
MMDFLTTSHLFASKFIFFTSYEQCWKKMYQITLLNLEIMTFGYWLPNIWPYFEQVPMGSIHNEIKVDQCLFWGEFSPLGLKREKMWFIKLGSLWKKMPKLQDFNGGIYGNCHI